MTTAKRNVAGCANEYGWEALIFLTAGSLLTNACDLLSTLFSEKGEWQLFNCGNPIKPASAAVGYNVATSSSKKI